MAQSGHPAAEGSEVPKRMMNGSKNMSLSLSDCNGHEARTAVAGLEFQGLLVSELVDEETSTDRSGPVGVGEPTWKRQVAVTGSLRNSNGRRWVEFKSSEEKGVVDSLKSKRLLFGGVIERRGGIGGLERMNRPHEDSPAVHNSGCDSEGQAVCRFWKSGQRLLMCAVESCADSTDDNVKRSISHARTFAIRFATEETCNSFLCAAEYPTGGKNRERGRNTATPTSSGSPKRGHARVNKGCRGEDEDISGNGSKFSRKIERASAQMYFHYYGQLLHQQNMLQDYVRTGTYYAAVMENKADFAGKVVVDVGAGTGILSLFAAQAGAKHVYAVEASSMADYARKLIAGNPQIAKQITVIQGKVEEVELPEKVDILISEPMGTLLVNERMLESYVIARDRFLKPSGQMFPAKGRIHLAPFSDECLYIEVASKALFWQQQGYYGVDLTPLQNAAFSGYFSQPVIDAFDPRILVASPVIHEIDFTKIKEEELYTVEVPLSFSVNAASRVHGLACWFDVLFDGSTTQRWLSTGPGHPTTHWYQVRLVLSQPLYLLAGQVITGKLNMTAHAFQSYNINLTMQASTWNFGILGGNCPSGMTGFQVSSGKMDLKEPYYRLSQMSNYGWTQDQQQQPQQQQVQQQQPQQQQGVGTWMGQTAGSPIGAGGQLNSRLPNGPISFGAHMPHSQKLDNEADGQLQQHTLHDQHGQYLHQQQQGGVGSQSSLQQHQQQFQYVQYGQTQTSYGSMQQQSDHWGTSYNSPSFYGKY